MAERERTEVERPSEVEGHMPQGGSEEPVESEPQRSDEAPEVEAGREGEVEGHAWRR